MELANSLAQVQSLASDNSVPNDKVLYFACCFVSSTQCALQLSQKVAKIEQVSIEDLSLDFTIPGYDIELRVRTHSPVR